MLTIAETMANTIDHLTLTRLVEAGAVQSARVVGQPGGWRVAVQTGATERVLAAKRGAVRVFRKFETLTGYLGGLGLTQFQVDAQEFGPLTSQPGRTRADASARLKNAHEAAAYAAWLTQEVQDAIDDPRPSIPHDVVMAEWEIERASLLQGLHATASVGS
jgi:hypothetical protein